MTWMKFAKKLLSSLALVGLACSCTVAPKAASSSQASFDCTDQNSGVVAELGDHSFIVTPHLRDRYNAMIAVYGNHFQPALFPDQGITPTGTNSFAMSPQAFENFLTMNRWRKQAAPPPFR